MALPRSRILVGALLAVGLLLRWPVMAGAHMEGDERIYRALAERLLAGESYGLQGHPLLSQAGLEPGVYDYPLFHHPPVGPALMALSLWLAGPAGFGLLQLLAYAAFAHAMLVLTRLALGADRGPERVAVAGLCAIQPIALHVGQHHWLDGLQLAFAAWAAACALTGARRPEIGPWLACGALLALAALVKLNALVLPLALAPLVVARAVLPRRALLWRGALALCLPAVAACVWLYVVWRAYGTAFPPWVGRPNAALIADNAYIAHVTASRGPLSYLWLLPGVCWTLPVCLAWAASPAARRAGAQSLAIPLAAWIGVTLGVHVVLAFGGYSRVLRYLILMVPALILLFGLCAGALWRRAFAGPNVDARSPPWAAALLAGAWLLELGQALRLVQSPEVALIPPLFG